jgi:hypothetical protein
MVHFSVRIKDFNFGSFFGIIRNPFLCDNECDLEGIVTGKQSATAKAICDVFSTASNSVGVEGSDTAESIAQRNAAHALFFSLCHLLQWLRLVTFRVGVR